MDIVERLRLEIGGYTDDYLEKAEADMNEAADEIERLREALQKIAAPSKVIAKNENAVVALQLLLSSHRKTALKALGGVSDGYCRTVA